MSGFAFQYDLPSRSYALVLRSTQNGQKVYLAISRSERENVADYFGVSQTEIGFEATGIIDPTNEYEVMIKWPWSISISTGVFVSTLGVHYSPESIFVAPGIKSDFVDNGVLRVYRPERHCWVYQNEGELFWIVDQDFNFEDDGSTYIQYQLFTSQPEKLPQERLDHNWFWDNIEGSFEDYEIYGVYIPTS